MSSAGTWMVCHCHVILEERKNFDRQETFMLGDPAASFDRPCGNSYERKYDNPHEGFPVWKQIFAYILRTRGYLQDYDTIYVLVDTRNLADHKTSNPGLPHWPAAVAWWESRLQMTGPMGERTELCFLLFVLAALGKFSPSWQLALHKSS